MSLIALRSMTPDDLPFVASSWVRSYAERGRTAQGVEFGVQIRGHQQAVDRLLRHATLLVTVAFNPDYPKQIVGWAAAEATSKGALVHYVYVKQNYRRHGFAKQLLEDTRLTKEKWHTHEVLDRESTPARPLAPAVSRLIKWLGSRYDPSKRNG